MISISTCRKLSVVVDHERSFRRSNHEYSDQGVELFQLILGSILFAMNWKQQDHANLWQHRSHQRCLQNGELSNLKSKVLMAKRVEFGNAPDRCLNAYARFYGTALI